MHPALRGAIAGTVATIPMTLVMLSLFRRLPSRQHYPLPPALITAELADRAGVRSSVSGPRLTATALAAHFGYGAVTGVLYSLLFSRRRPRAVIGTGYGLAVWAASYLGWIPAARILTPATQHPPERNGLMWIAHIVWGASVAGSDMLLERASERSNQVNQVNRDAGIARLSGRESSATETEREEQRHIEYRA